MLSLLFYFFALFFSPALSFYFLLGVGTVGGCFFLVHSNGDYFPCSEKKKCDCYLGGVGGGDGIDEKVGK